MKNEKTPNFFIVGFPRCGTSSLHHYLKQHPNIFMPEFKEPIYFCKDIVQESIDFHKPSKPSSYHITTSEEDYKKIFKKKGDEKVVGEASGWYLKSKVAAQEIHKHNPDSKIIILIREPSSLLYSLHSQLYYAGNEQIPSFEEALNAEKERKKGKLKNKHVSWPSILFYSEVTKFTKQIDRYLKIFPKKQIKFIIFDDLKAKTPEIYKELLEFLEVDPGFQPEFKIVHGSKKERFKIPFKPFLKNFATTHFSRKTTFYIAKILKLINTKHVKRPKLKEKTKLKLMKTHKEEVEKLSKLLNRNLVELWGYNKIKQ